MERHVEDEINRKLKIRLNELESILCENNPSHVELIKATILKHGYPLKCVLRLDMEKRKRIKKEIDNDIRCMARTGAGSQCRRPIILNDAESDSKHCLSHVHSLPYGNIDEEMPVPIITKKRGKRGKSKQFDTKDLNQDLYVQSVLVHIEDVPYLIDEHDVLYSFKNENEIIGYVKSDNDEVIWF